ncbi:MAG: class I SAM-dependent methyltransferase [Acetobacteraceae bacterium]
MRALFNRAAADYDSANAILSLGTGQRYRRRALQVAGLCAGMQVLDVATGTGLTAREALHLTGPAGAVIGVDVSEAMLAQARRVPGLHCVQARAEALPVASDRCDFVTMGYALRHVPDLAAYFQECHRVLRPGGTILILEIIRPPNRLAMALAAFYMRVVVPALCSLRGRRTARTLLEYYWATIEACVPPPVVTGALAGAGFTDVSVRTELGLFALYVGRKPR